MKLFINNAIALGFHLLLAVGVSATATIFFSGSAVWDWLLLLLPMLLYTVCGFCLKPLRKRTYLSPLSVAVLLAALLLITFIFGFNLTAYLLANPFLAAVDGLGTPAVSKALLPISPLIPSLLMLAGITLRKRFLREI